VAFSRKQVFGEQLPLSAGISRAACMSATYSAALTPLLQ
jgi:hypothetical protein